jgi:hypothetical protein
VAVIRIQKIQPQSSDHITAVNGDKMITNTVNIVCIDETCPSLFNNKDLLAEGQGLLKLIVVRWGPDGYDICHWRVLNWPTS